MTDDALIHGYGQSAGRSRLLDHSEVGARARTDGAAAPPAKRVSACCALMFSTRDIVQVHYRGEGVFIGLGTIDQPAQEVQTPEPMRRSRHDSGEDDQPAASSSRRGSNGCSRGQGRLEADSSNRLSSVACRFRCTIDPARRCSAKHRRCVRASCA